MTRTHSTRLAPHTVALVVALAASTGAGCPAEPPQNPCLEAGDLCGQATLGEMVYVLVESAMEDADSCAEVRVETLSEREALLVRTFDEAITENLVAQPGALTDLVDNAVQPLVRDGRLPALTDAGADALALLVDDTRDPEREALAAFMALSETESVAEPEVLTRFATTLLDDPTLVDTVRAMASIANTDDGVAPVLDSLLTLIPESRTPNAPNACGEIRFPTLEETLLNEAGYPPLADGEAAWVARADATGRPSVGTRARDGLPAPFVDLDDDGAPDTDAEGDRIDAAGDVIALPSIAGGDPSHGATTFARDEAGRPLAADGAPLYAYFDVRRTALGHLLALGHDALGAGVHRDAFALVDAILGEAQPCFDGTQSCRRYPADDHPVADLVFALLEVGKNPGAGELMASVAALFEEDPDLADALLGALGQLLVELDTIDTPDAPDADESLLVTLRDLIPVIDALFVTRSMGDEPTARVLMRSLIDVSQSNADVEIAPLLNATEVRRAPLCSDAIPTIPADAEVDFSRPRWDGERDNRAVMEKVIELFADANACSQNLTIDTEDGELSGTIAFVALHQLAGRGPGEVCGVATDLLATIEAFGDAFGEDNLDVILESLLGCPDGAAMREGLESLESLAASGGLDAVMPLAQVFRDRGELNTLIALVEHLAEDLRREDAGGRSPIRALLPSLAALFETNAASALLDVMIMLDGEPAPTTVDATLADVFIDTLAYGVRRRTFIDGRRATARDTSHIEEILRHAERVRVRISDAGAPAEDALDGLLDFVGDRLALDATSAPSEPRLADARLRPTLAHLTRVLAQLATLNDEAYPCHIGALQDDAITFLEGRDFATLVRVARASLEGDDAAQLDGFILSLLDESHPLHISLLQIAGAALSTTPAVDEAQTDALLDYLRDVVDQRRGDAAALVATIEALLSAEGASTLLAMARDLIETDPATGDSRIAAFTDVWDDLSRVDGPACTPDEAERDLARVEDRVRTLAELIDSRPQGSTIRLIYDLLE